MTEHTLQRLMLSVASQRVERDGRTTVAAVHAAVVEETVAAVSVPCDEGAVTKTRPPVGAVGNRCASDEIKSLV